MVAMPNLCIEGDRCSSAFLQKHLHIQSCRTRKYSGFRFECPFALEQKGARFSQSALLLIPWDGIWNGFFAAKGLSRDVHSNVTHPDKHDKIAVAYEDTLQNDLMCVQFRNGKIEFGDPVKWPKGSPAYRIAEGTCSGAATQAGLNAVDVVGHRDAALHDTCEEGRK